MSTIIGLVSTFRLPLHSTSLLDLIMPSPHSNVQSATLRLPFWTSLCLPYTLKSTPAPDEPATSGGAAT